MIKFQISWKTIFFQKLAFLFLVGNLIPAEDQPCGGDCLPMGAFFWFCSPFFEMLLHYLLLTYFEYIRKSRLEKLYQVRYMSLWIHNEYSCMQELYTFRFTNAVACMYKARQGIHYNNIKCIRYDSFIFGLFILNLRILLLRICKYFVDLQKLWPFW